MRCVWAAYNSDPQPFQLCGQAAAVVVGGSGGGEGCFCMCKWSFMRSLVTCVDWFPMDQGPVCELGVWNPWLTVL